MRFWLSDTTGYSGTTGIPPDILIRFLLAAHNISVKSCNFPVKRLEEFQENVL